MLDFAIILSYTFRLRLGWCSATQLEQMFIRFYKSDDKDTERLAKEFAQNILAHKRNVSPAQIQGFFMFYKNEPEAVLNNVSKIWELT